MKAWWRKRKGRIIALVTILLLGAAGLAPWVAWRLRDPLTMDVIVVDKTLAQQNYRKHAALFWVMRHTKVRQRATGADFRDDRDYAGYHPGTRGTPGTVVPIPDSPADFIYLSDTYGVYQHELGPPSKTVHSKLVYGGLSRDELSTLTHNLRPGGTLVGEFNIITNGVDAPTQSALSQTFGVRWTGWFGRHFAYLDLTPDLPAWLPAAWKAQTGERWTFRGPGYVFAQEDGRVVVLVEGKDTPKNALTLQVDSRHAKEFGTAQRLRFDGWVEIVAPAASAEVLATYELPLTPTGTQKMRDVPISGRWPAAIRTRTTQRTTYYFAGDWSDRPAAGRYGYTLIPWWKRLIVPDDRDSVETFFWNVYTPMMTRILREAARTAERR